MNEQPTSATAIGDDGSTIEPRFLSFEQMRIHHGNRLVTELAPHPRHQMFVRYDGTWWIGDGATGFHEITSPTQNAKLDRWHERLTNGALWT